MTEQKDIGEYILYSNGDVYSKYFKRLLFQKPTGLLKNQVMGSKHKDARFTPLQIQVVREALTLGYIGFQIARYFKVNRSTIYRIKTNEHWKQLV